jgi:hypothetical protein
LSANGAGSYAVVVHLHNQGNSNSDQKYTFSLEVTSLSSYIGNLFLNIY